MKGVLVKDFGVVNRGDFQADVSELTSGVYVLRYLTDKKDQLEKLIIR